MVAQLRQDRHRRSWWSTNKNPRPTQRPCKTSHWTSWASIWIMEMSNSSKQSKGKIRSRCKTCKNHWMLLVVCQGRALQRLSMSTWCKLPTNRPQLTGHSTCKELANSSFTIDRERPAQNTSRQRSHHSYEISHQVRVSSLWLSQACLWSKVQLKNLQP